MTAPAITVTDDTQMLLELLLALATLEVPDASSPRAVLSSLERADNGGDPQSVMALYADDAVLLPPGESPVSGKAAIRARYTALFGRARMSARFEVDEARTAGAIGSIRGRMTGRRTSSDGGVEDLTGKFVMLFRKERSGWLITSLIWNADH